MDRCRRTGDFTRIGSHADRLLAIDHLSEEATRAKMEACALAGDRISAIRIFQAWRQRLADELDAHPSPLVEGMALRLRQRGCEPPGTAHIPTVPTDHWRNRAFVGRALQYRALYERWELTSGGRGRHGLVLGDSGIGKTTLVERLSTAAGLEGAVSSRVQCYEVERELPYSAIGTLVRGLLDRPGASGTPPEWLAELARTIPAVAQRYPDLPPARESAGETARLRLTEGVHELVSAIAEEHPVILVVDDVHLADDASVAVLHLLMRRTQSQRIMVIMTARQGELANSPHAGRLLEAREPLGLEAVELPPLTEEEMSEVVSALAAAADSTVPPAIKRALLLASAGVPMIVELLFDDWRAHGEECLALSVGAMTVDAFSNDQREVYHRIFDRTLRGLSDPARAVLNLAAILGERLNDLTMYQLVDLSLAQTLAGMAELERCRILRDGGREVEFRNELLRGYTYLSVPSPLRRALHGLIADRLLAAEARGDRVPGLMLAWHCFRAGRPLEAEPYLLRGSREALRRGGTFEVELALTSGMKGLTPATAVEAQLLLSDALQEQDRHQEALQVLEQVSATQPRDETRRTLALLRSRAALAQGVAEARDSLSSLRPFLEENVPCPVRVAALEVSVPLVLYLGDRSEARRLIRVAETLEDGAEELEGKITVGRALWMGYWLSKGGRSLPDLNRKLELLADRCTREGLDNAATWMLHTTSGSVCLATGDYQRAIQCFKNAYRIGRKLGSEEKIGSNATGLAIAYGRIGEYPLQAQFAERSRSCFTARDSWRRDVATYYAAFANCMMGENKTALSLIDSLESWETSTRPEWILQCLPLMKADILLAAGHKDKAAKMATEGLDRSGVEPLTESYAGMVARWLARLAAGRSEYPGSAVLKDLSEDLETHDVMDQAEILAARVWLDERNGGQWSTGRELLASALARLPAAVEHQLRRLDCLC
jgi:predicted ATPase